MGLRENGVVSISKQDWSLNRQGSQDSLRHDEKVKEAIKDNLQNIISDGAIITADPSGRHKVKVPLKSLELPNIRYKQGDKGAGSGEGNEGDVIARGKGDKKRGKEAGEEAGIEYYETDLSIEELQEMIFRDLGLPNLLPKKMQDITSEKPVFNQIKHKKTTNNLDLQRTIFANMTRNALEKGSAKIGGIKQEDFRVRTWEHEIKQENRAVVIPMRDISGSMGEFEIYVSRVFCWWTVKFLRTKYPNVDITFVAHDTEAYEVDEEKFFTRGAGGGTKCSSANIKALEIIKERHPLDSYNIYPMHFSDGENYGYDNDLAVKAVNELLDLPVNLYVYMQISQRPDLLLDLYQRSIKNPRFYGGHIAEKGDIWPNLRAVFDPTKTLEA